MEYALRDLGEKLFGGFEPEDGFAESQLAKAENRLSVRLPATLRNFYRLAGKNKIVSKAHNRFLGLQNLHMRNNALIFLEQNQKVMFWGIFAQDLEKDDPPVQQGNFSEDDWYVDANFLSAFLLGIVCWQAANGMQWSAEGIRHDALVAKIRNGLTYADPLVDDKENDLTGFYKRGLVVSVSRSAKKIMVSANEKRLLAEFEKEFDTGLNYL